MKETSIKSALAQSIIDKIVAHKEANSNWTYRFKEATVFVPEVKTIVPEANGIWVKFSDKRCYLQFINIAPDRWVSTSAKTKAVASFNKLGASQRDAAANFINSLEAIGNVKPFAECSEWFSGMKQETTTK